MASTDDPKLMLRWVGEWADLIEFETLPVLPEVGGQHRVVSIPMALYFICQPRQKLRTVTARARSERLRLEDK